jgi:squalene synthase HpnC
VGADRSSIGSGPAGQQDGPAGDPVETTVSGSRGVGRSRAAEGAENFPVAMRVLPRELRLALRAVYDVVRVIDDLGDEPGPVARSGTETNAGDTAERRVARLDAFAADLGRVWAGGRPAAPVLRALVPVVRGRGLMQDPFDRLIAANLADQRVERYETLADLLGYCALSAVPIGRLVLQLFRVDAPAGSPVEQRADAVCTALQLLEHCQDVAEDRARGRVYLPADDLRVFGVAEADLDAPHATPALARLVRHETDRALELLGSGAGVVADLHGWARVAVAGYVAGGRAAGDALLRVHGDVLGRVASTRRRDVLRHLVVALASARSAPARLAQASTVRSTP